VPSNLVDDRDFYREKPTRLGVRQAGKRLSRAAERAAEDRRAAKRLAEELSECTREKDDAYKTLNKDQAEYDKQLLVLSAGFLALALGFIKDVVPLNEAIHRPALYFGFSLLALCVFSVLGSYQYSIRAHFRLAEHWRKKSIMLESSEDDRPRLEQELATIRDKIANDSENIKRVNWGSGVLFALGVAVLVYFVVSNLEAQSHMRVPEHVSDEWRQQMTRPSNPPSPQPQPIPTPSHPGEPYPSTPTPTPGSHPKPPR